MTTMTLPSLLSKEEIEAKAPSIYQIHPSPKVSKKYQFFSSEELMDALGKLGWKPYKVLQETTTVKKKDVANFKKHIIYFRQVGDQANEFNCIPHIVSINSHNGSTPLKLYGGILRLVCLNGAIAETSQFEKLNQRHIGISFEEVTKASLAYVESVGSFYDSVKNCTKVKLTEQQKLKLAEQFMQIRYPNGRDSLQISDLLVPRRDIDKQDDLWTVFNVLQENLTKGGISTIASSKEKEVKRKTKEITSISEIIRVNTEMWNALNSFTEKA